MPTAISSQRCRPFGYSNRVLALVPLPAIRCPTPTYWDSTRSSNNGSWGGVRGAAIRSHRANDFYGTRPLLRMPFRMLTNSALEMCLPHSSAPCPTVLSRASHEPCVAIWQRFGAAGCGGSTTLGDHSHHGPPSTNSSNAGQLRSLAPNRGTPMRRRAWGMLGNRAKPVDYRPLFSPLFPEHPTRLASHRRHIAPAVGNRHFVVPGGGSGRAGASPCRERGMGSHQGWLGADRHLAHGAYRAPANSSARGGRRTGAPLRVRPRGVSP